MKIILISVWAGVVEELSFRQLLQTMILQDRFKLNTHKAVIITSLMFAMVHMVWWAVPVHIVAGLLFGYARAYGGFELSDSITYSG